MYSWTSKRFVQKVWLKANSKMNFWLPKYHLCQKPVGHFFWQSVSDSAIPTIFIQTNRNSFPMLLRGGGVCFFWTRKFFPFNLTLLVHPKKKKLASPLIYKKNTKILISMRGWFWFWFWFCCGLMKHFGFILGFILVFESFSFHFSKHFGFGFRNWFSFGFGFGCWDFSTVLSDFWF